MFTTLKRLFSGPDPLESTAYDLYQALVAQARLPVFYADYGVPDTVDGRFEMILMHAFAVMRRLKEGDEAHKALSQKLYDVMFMDMDRSIRELGVSDVRVGKHMKRMMSGFYGRVDAYETGLTGDGDLADAIERNLFGTVDAKEGDVKAMVAYLEKLTGYTANYDLTALVEGRLNFEKLN